jgi:lysophospholipase L1-like esterase
LSSEADITAKKWRVLVLGNSVTRMVPGRPSRLDGPYPEVLEQLLREDGFDVEVRNEGGAFTTIRDGVRRYHDVVASWSPDVVIINFGVIDSQTPVIPKGVYNHFQTSDVGAGRVARAYRGRVAPMVWKRLRQLQRGAAQRMGGVGHRVGPQRYVASLRQLIFLSRYDHRLVLVLDVNPPGPRVEYAMPGATQRHARYNELTVDVVRAAHETDPDVRLVRASDVIAQLGMDKAVPDAFHFSADAHRHVAEMLAAEIEPWLR